MNKNEQQNKAEFKCKYCGHLNKTDIPVDTTKKVTIDARQLSFSFMKKER